jgi:hypothetical protein
MCDSAQLVKTKELIKYETGHSDTWLDAVEEPEIINRGAGRRVSTIK